MVKLCLVMCDLKNLQLETAHLAINLADRYLMTLGPSAYPNLSALAITSLLTAAKLGEHTFSGVNKFRSLLNS
jgi:hypothetical protein